MTTVTGDVRNTHFDQAVTKADLAVTFNCNINFETHINKSVTKANQLQCFIYRNSKDMKDVNTLI